MKSNLSDCVDGIIVIFQSLKEINADNLIGNNFVKENWDIERYRDILAYLSQDKNRMEYVPYFSNAEFQANLIERIKNTIVNGQFKMDDYFALNAMLKMNTNINDYQNMTQLVINRIYELRATETEIQQLLLTILLFYINGDTSMPDRLLGFVQSGRIFRYFQQSLHLNDFTSCVMCILIKLLYYSQRISFNFPDTRLAGEGLTKFNSIQSQDFYKEQLFWDSIIKIMQQHPMLYNNLFEVLSNADEEINEVRLFKDIIKQHFALDNNNAITILAAFLLSQSLFIRQALHEGNEEIFNEYVKKSVGQEGLTKYIDNIEYDKDNLNHHSFAENIFALNLDNGKFAEWIHKSLKSADKSKWIELIKGSSYSAAIVEYLSTKYNKKFDLPLREALEEIADEIIEADKEPEYEVANISKYICGLDDEASIVFKGNMRDRLIDNVESDLTYYIKYFGELLKDCSVWQDKVDDFCRKYLMKEVERPIIDELNWCIELIMKCRFNKGRRSAIKAAIREIKEKLKGKLQEENLESDIKTSLEKLQSLF